MLFLRACKQETVKPRLESRFSSATIVGHPVFSPYSVAFLMQIFLLRTCLFLQSPDTGIAHSFVQSLPSPMPVLSKYISSEHSAAFMQETCPSSIRESFCFTSLLSESWPPRLISAYSGLVLAFP